MKTAKEVAAYAKDISKLQRRGFTALLTQAQTKKKENRRPPASFAVGKILDIHKFIPWVWRDATA